MCNLLLIILFYFIEQMYFTKAAEDVFYYSAGLQSEYKRSISKHSNVKKMKHDEH